MKYSGAFIKKYGEYFKIKEFLDIFIYWSADIKQVVKDFTDRYSKKDPAKYGHERSLIAVKL